MARPLAFTPDQAAAATFAVVGTKLSVDLKDKERANTEMTASVPHKKRSKYSNFSFSFGEYKNDVHIFGIIMLYTCIYIYIEEIGFDV